MKIFLDVDNTILEHYGFYSYKTEGRIHKSMAKYPIQNSEAISHMFKTSICHDPMTIKRLLMHHDTYILTKYNDLKYEEEKRKKLAEIFEMTVEELMSLKDLNGKNKYIAVKAIDSKVDVVKHLLEVDSISDYILVDDYSQNIIEWEHAGGIGFKYFNQYNSKEHPTNGISISNFKIFDYYIQKNKLSHIITAGNNKYKLKLLLEEIKNFTDTNSIDLLKVVYKDVQNRFEISEIHEHNKYSHADFLTEYYWFLEDIKPAYINSLVNKGIDNDKMSIITTTFEPNLLSLTTSLPVESNIVSLSINSENDEKTANIYDIYLTIAEERFIDDINLVNGRIFTLLKKMLFN